MRYHVAVHDSGFGTRLPKPPAAIDLTPCPLVSPLANTTSASLLPHRSPLVAEAATTPAMSPTEMMINYNRPLPVERWDAF
jgi:hypothetical protein